MPVCRVVELMDHFRSALLALIPVAERARIEWRGPRVYDPWEDIERTPFQSFAASVPENALAICAAGRHPVESFFRCLPDRPVSVSVDDMSQAIEDGWTIDER